MHVGRHGVCCCSQQRTPTTIMAAVMMRVTNVLLRLIITTINCSWFNSPMIKFVVWRVLALFSHSVTTGRNTAKNSRRTRKNTVIAMCQQDTRWIKDWESGWAPNDSSTNNSMPMPMTMTMAQQWTLQLTHDANARGTILIGSLTCCSSCGCCLFFRRLFALGSAGLMSANSKCEWMQFNCEFNNIIFFIVICHWGHHCHHHWCKEHCGLNVDGASMSMSSFGIISCCCCLLLSLWILLSLVEPSCSSHSCSHDSLPSNLLCQHEHPTLKKMSDNVLLLLLLLLNDDPSFFLVVVFVFFCVTIEHSTIDAHWRRRHDCCCCCCRHHCPHCGFFVAVVFIIVSVHSCHLKFLRRRMPHNVFIVMIVQCLHCCNHWVVVVVVVVNWDWNIFFSDLADLLLVQFVLVNEQTCGVCKLHWVNVQILCTNAHVWCTPAPGTGNSGTFCSALGVFTTAQHSRTPCELHAHSWGPEECSSPGSQIDKNVEIVAMMENMPIDEDDQPKIKVKHVNIWIFQLSIWKCLEVTSHCKN